MAKTTEILYHNGVPIDVREMRDGAPRQYGRAETPANGYVVVRVTAAKKDIDPDFLERAYGGKFHLDESLCTEDEKQLLKDMNRYQWKAHAIKHTITPQRLVKICADKRQEWENKKAEAEAESRLVGG